MASEAIAGVGTRFQRWSGSAYEDIAEINSIEGPGMTKDVIEVTSLDTDAGYNEFITGFAEGGTLTLNMNFTRETYELMNDDFELDELRYYNIILSDDLVVPTALSFAGFVIDLPIVIEADDKITADVTIQISSMVDLELGSGAPSEEEEIPIPVFQSAHVDNATPTQIHMLYDLSLSGSYVPATTAFTVTVAGSGVSETNVAVSGTQVTVTIGTTITTGQSVTIAYTKPATNFLRTAAGGEAESLTAQSVTNNVGTSYDSDLVTYWTGLTTPLSTAQKDRLQTFVTAIKTGLGITNLSDMFGVFYMFHNETQEAALRNLVERAHDGVAPSGADLPQFTAWEGFTPTYASLQCIDTQFNPEDADSAVLGYNNVSVGHYIINDIDLVSTTRYSWGNGIYNQVIQRYGATGPDVIRGNLNGSAMQTLYSIDSTKDGGYLVLSRITAGELATSLDDDSPNEIASNAALHFPDYSMVILRSRDAAGALSTGSTNNGVSMWHMGSGLNSAEKDVIYNAFIDYLGDSV